MGEPGAGQGGTGQVGTEKVGTGQVKTSQAGQVRTGQFSAGQMVKFYLGLECGPTQSYLFMILLAWKSFKKSVNLFVLITNVGKIETYEHNIQNQYLFCFELFKGKSEKPKST